jgi:hypothetical protein
MVAAVAAMAAAAGRGIVSVGWLLRYDSKDDQSGTRAEIYCVHTTQPTSGMNTHVNNRK